MLALLRRLGAAIVERAIERAAARVVDGAERAFDDARAPAPPPDAPLLWCACGDRLRRRGRALACERCER